MSLSLPPSEHKGAGWCFAGEEAAAHWAGLGAQGAAWGSSVIRLRKSHGVVWDTPFHICTCVAGCWHPYMHVTRQI